MTELVFFLEEPSARAMLEGLLPRLLPESICCRYIVFEGKQDLEKQLSVKLRGWRLPDCYYVVLRDQDSGDCIKIKRALVQKCHDAGKPNALVRIVCHELESWYLGDLNAVEQAIGPRGLSSKQQKIKYRSPDYIANAAEELTKISPTYQKVGGSRKIGPLLNIEMNRSTSFQVFISGVKHLMEEICP